MTKDEAAEALIEIAELIGTGQPLRAGQRRLADIALRHLALNPAGIPGVRPDTGPSARLDGYAMLRAVTSRMDRGESWTAATDQVGKAHGSTGKTVRRSIQRLSHPEHRLVELELLGRQQQDPRMSEEELAEFLDDVAKLIQVFPAD